MKRKLFGIICLVLCIMFIFSSCGGDKNVGGENFSDFEKYGDRPVAVLTLEDGSVIKMELYPEIAPKSVNLFVKNVEAKYYDGKVFHRAINGFMIQGGSLDGNGVGGSGNPIYGEFASNGFENNLAHLRGVVSLARTNDPDSAEGQFFIMHGEAPWLDGEYAAFGSVIEGMDIVDKIATMEVRGSNNDSLVIKPVIKSIVMLEK